MFIMTDILNNKNYSQIRRNIRDLYIYADEISKCRSLRDYENLARKLSVGLSQKLGDELKGSLGENFFDELRMKYGSTLILKGIAEPKPATRDEDWQWSFDTKSYSSKVNKDGKQEKQIHQDKFWPSRYKLEWDDISLTLQKTLRGEVLPQNVYIWFTGTEEDVDHAILKSFLPGHVLTREYWENYLEDNAGFFKEFADRIIDESTYLKNLSKSIISEEKSKKKTWKPYQTKAKNKALAVDRGFIQMPPGAGKTLVQAGIFESLLRASHRKGKNENEK